MFQVPSIHNILSGYISYEFILAAGPKYPDIVYKSLIVISQPNHSLELN